MSKLKLTRVVKKHKKNCHALKLVHEGSWNTPWCLGKHVFGDANGSLKRRFGWHSWLQFRCNDNKCPAILLVREDAVLEKFQP